MDALTSTPLLDAPTGRSQPRANVVQHITSDKEIIMARQSLAASAAPRPGTRRRHRSMLVRRSSLWAMVLMLALGAPIASATPLVVPNFDDGGGGSASNGSQQTVSRLFNEVFTQQRGEVCTELMTGGAQHETPIGLFEGPDGFNDFASTIWTAFPDATFVIDDILEADGAISVRWSMTGTHLGTLDDQAATGNRVSLQGLAYFTFDANRISDSWIAYDRLGLLDQASVPLAPAPTCAECRELPS